MGKRQIRIFRKDLVSRALELMQRQEVQVVLQNKVVLNGVLRELQSEGLQLEDHRFNRHRVPLEQVSEIIYDVEAPY